MKGPEEREEQAGMLADRMMEVLSGIVISTISKDTDEVATLAVEAAMIDGYCRQTGVMGGMMPSPMPAALATTCSMALNKHMEEILQRVANLRTVSRKQRQDECRNILSAARSIWAGRASAIVSTGEATMSGKAPAEMKQSLEASNVLAEDLDKSILGVIDLLQEYADIELARDWQEELVPPWADKAPEWLKKLAATS